MVGTRGDIDKGWAWVVALACTLWNALFVGIIRSFGLLYTEVIEVFNSRPAVACWVPATFAICITLMSPVSGFLSDRWSVRRMVVVAGVVGCFGYIASAYAPNIQMVVVGYGVITGIAGGAVDAPILAQLNRFFRRRRSLANGIAFAGSSAGTLLLPLIFAELIRSYTVRGTFLVAGGIWLNACVVGMVLRPVHVPGSSTPERESISIHVEDAEYEREVLACDQYDVGCHRIKTEEYIVKGQKEAVAKVENAEITQLLPEEGTSEKYTACSDDATELRKNDQTEEFERNLSGLEATNENIRNGAKTKTLDPGDIRTEENVAARKQPSDEELKRPKRMSLRQLIRNAGFVRLQSFLLCGFLGYLTVLFLMPPFAKERGFSLLQSSVILSCAGFADLTSRLFWGAAGDLKILRNNRGALVATSYVLCGCATIILPYFNHFSAMLIFVLFFGFFGGIFVVYMSHFMVETAGEQNLGSSMGAASMALGLASAAGPPMAGFIKEETGEYVLAVRLCGVFYLTGAAIYNLRMKNLSTIRKICVHIHTRLSNRTEPP